MAHRAARMSNSKQEPVDFLGLVQEIEQSLLVQARQPNVYAYEPHKRQLEFHKLQERERLFVAGNRSGKSVASVVEAVWYLTKSHPFRENLDGQVRGRVVCVDFLNGVDKIILPLYKQYMPKDFLIDGSWDKSYSAQQHTLTLKDGSFVEFMSQDQDLDKFAGTSRHFIHFDEECPKVIFDECQMRLLDTNGYWWISETPVAGMEWIYDDLYQPYFESLEKGEEPRIGLVQMRTDENPYLAKEAIERIFGTMDQENKAVRFGGEYLAISGALYKEFKEVTHANQTLGEYGFDSNRMRVYLTGDHGISNPTAWLWVAADIKGGLTVIKEYYQANATVADHAKVIDQVNAELGCVPYMVTGDPAMKQRSGITGESIISEYAKHGIYINVDGIPRKKEVGINKIMQYLKVNPKTGKPFLTILRECHNSIRELKGAKQNRFVNKKVAAMRNQPEGQREKDDHTTDALRYLMTFMPDLTPEDYAGESEDHHEYAEGLLDVSYSHRSELERRNSRALNNQHNFRGGGNYDFGGME